MPPIPPNPLVVDAGGPIDGDGLAQVDMGGKFSPTLKLSTPFYAHGPFTWGDCYLLSVFISQSGGRAASALDRPDLVSDPDKAGGTIWRLPLKTTPGATSLRAGRAFASSVGLVNDNGAVGLVQWAGFITLTS